MKVYTRNQLCNAAFQGNIKHNSYSVKLILNTTSTYNLSYTLEQTKKGIAKGFYAKIPESTIRSQTKQYFHG